jgi:hypothetical protein
MVSSTVYGIEDLLEKVYGVLTGYGYEVWMSHKGTIPMLPNLTAFESCLLAVEKCDLFLSIITTHYGSGKEEKDALSITHQELLKAIDLNKPRWVLAHDNVPFTRILLSGLGHDTAEKRAALRMKPMQLIDDLRVVDMYEAATRHELNLRDRKGNWVQKFVSPDDALLFASAQFFRYQEIEKFLEENFEDKKSVAKVTRKKVAS